MGKKTFRAPVSQDFEIIEDDQVVGTLRVKPSGLSWAPKGSHVWYRVGIEAFGDFAVKKGEQQDK